MKQLQNLREAIIIAHNRGKKQAEIADFLGITQGAVSKTIKRFEETGSNVNRKREKTARSKKNILRAKTMIKRNPSTKANSTRKLAKKLGVSDFSMSAYSKKFRYFFLAFSFFMHPNNSRTKFRSFKFHFTLKNTKFKTNLC